MEFEENILINETSEYSYSTESYFSSEQSYATGWNKPRLYRNFVCSSISIAVNSFTLVTLCRTHKLGPRIRVMLISMTLNDVIFSFVTILCTSLPFAAVMHTYLCYVWISISCFVYLNSCFSVIIITIDRLLAVYCPLAYRRHATLTKTVVAVSSGWLLSTALIAATMASSAHQLWELFVPCVALKTGPGVFGLYLAVLALVCVVLMAAMHLLIWVKIWKRQRMVAPAPARAPLFRSQSHDRICLRPVHIDQALEDSGYIITSLVTGPAVILHHADQASNEVLCNINHRHVEEDRKREACATTQKLTGQGGRSPSREHVRLSPDSKTNNAKETTVQSVAREEQIPWDIEMNTSTDKERIAAKLSCTRTGLISTKQMHNVTRTSSECGHFLECVPSRAEETFTENCAEFSSSEMEDKRLDVVKDTIYTSSLFPGCASHVTETEVSVSKERKTESCATECPEEQKRPQRDDVISSFTSRNASPSEQKTRPNETVLFSVTSPNPNLQKESICQNDYKPSCEEKSSDQNEISAITSWEGSATRFAIPCTSTAVGGSLCHSISETISAVSSTTVASYRAATPSDVVTHEPDSTERTQRLCCCCIFTNCSISVRGNRADTHARCQHRRRRKPRGDTSASSASCTMVAGRAGALALALTAMFMAAHFPMAVYFVWATSRDVLLHFPTENTTLYYALLVNSIEGILRPLIYFWRVVGCERARKVCCFVCKAA